MKSGTKINVKGKVGSRKRNFWKPLYLSVCVQEEKEDLARELEEEKQPTSVRK